MKPRSAIEVPRKCFGNGLPRATVRFPSLSFQQPADYDSYSIGARPVRTWFLFSLTLCRFKKLQLTRQKHVIIIIIRGATAVTNLGRLGSRRWQSFPTAPDGTGLTCGQHNESHSCIFQLSKPDRYFFIQVTTQFIRSRGWVDPVPDPTPPEKS
jgi:hypothetical protein